MTTADRIVAILQAQTIEQLQEAMDGYYDELVAANPQLSQSQLHPLKTCLESHVYTHALADLEKIDPQAKATYPDAYKVLEAADAQHRKLGGGVPTDLRKRQP